MTVASATAVEELPNLRRHDLDALRAFVMLLGIGLHTLISFIPGPSIWAVKDKQTSNVFALMLASPA